MNDLEILLQRQWKTSQFFIYVKETLDKEVKIQNVMIISKTLFVALSTALQ